MRIQENVAKATALLDKMTDAFSEDRTGQHPAVGDLIRCVTQSYYDVHQEPRVRPGPKQAMFFLIGLALEEAILGKLQTKPKSGQFEGVYYHLDSLDEGWVELKSTRVSPGASKDGKRPAGAEGYLQYGFAKRQLLSYAATQGLLELDLGIIYVIPAEFKVFHITFEQEEVDEHWAWMKQRKAVWDEAMNAVPKRPPKAYTYNEDWECPRCQYQILCEYSRMTGN